LLAVQSFCHTNAAKEPTSPHSLTFRQIFLSSLLLADRDEYMTSIKKVFSDSQHIILYGAVMAVLVFALKWLQWKYLIADNASDIYIGLIAVLFTSLGAWMATQLSKPKIQTVLVEKEIVVSQPDDNTVNEIELKKLNLSTREYEVLQLLVQGLTNAEIAGKLFLSLSTVKTHVSNLFAKMDVKNRTQVVEKANRLRIIQQAR